MKLLLPPLVFAWVMALPPSPAGAVAVTKPAAKTKTKAKAAVPTTSPQQRAEAQRTVQQRVAESRENGLLNPAALIPFFELLYRHEHKAAAPIHILHFGDSHIAADDWTNSIREKMQARFGNGGPGYAMPGRPFAGYRRYDAKGWETRGWHTEGLLSRKGDGLYGLSGVAIESNKTGERITFDAEADSIELYYWRQPGGGTFAVSEDDQEMSRISTDAEAGPGFAKFKLPPGLHALSLATVDSAPVRLFGWAAEKNSGVTWESMGINGAPADLMLTWDEALWRSHVRRRDPSLVVLAYDTNEARRANWPIDNYRAAFLEVVQRVRAAAPLASILIIGPSDHATRTRRGWQPHPGIDAIIAVQREVALANGCAFWNLRAAMGGYNSMPNWVRAGLAQGDYVHFTTTGYRLLGESFYELLMSQYDIFLGVRKQLMGKEAPTPSNR
jgi:hypothetical protein